MKTRLQDNFLVFESGFTNIINIDVSIKKVMSELSLLGITGQGLALKTIAGKKQILLAVKQTIKAFQEKKSFLAQPELELILRMTARKQTKGLLEEVGLKEGRQEALLLAFGKNEKKVRKGFELMKKEFNFKNEKKLLEKSAEKNALFLKKFFGLSQEMIKAFKDLKEKEALEELILEKIALSGVMEKK